MKKLFILVSILVLFIFPSFAMAAGTCAKATPTTARGLDNKPIDLIKYTWTWTADGAGAVSGEGATTITGLVIGVQFVWVDANALYDVTLVETGGSTDVINGVGANLSQATTDRTPLTTDDRYLPLVRSIITPSVTGAGAGSTGSIVLYVVQ